MKEAIVCRKSPARTLAVTAAPLRELQNFLIYRQNPEILNERTRRQPHLKLTRFPKNVEEIGEFLKAAKCERDRKLYFDCSDIEQHRSLLIHNFDAQFWVHYFRGGIGLVSVSCFDQLASAEGSVLPSMSRTVDHSYEYQWFTHDLGDKYFQKGKPDIFLNRLGKYFAEEVNPKLVSPYVIYSEEKGVREAHKFISGSLENLKEIMKLAFLVYEGIKEEGIGQYRNNSSLTILCGNLKHSPSIEYPDDWFINEVAALALKENTPFVVMNEGYYRRVVSIFSDNIRTYKSRIYLNFHEQIWGSTPRERIAARFHLVKWLKKQGKRGEWIIRNWKLSNL